MRRNYGFIVVHRLDNLRRSGRIGGAAAWLGSALALKPLLRIDDGRLVLAQRARTASKALAAMIDRVCDVIGDSTAAVAVHHVANEEGAAVLAATLAERLPACRRQLSPIWVRSSRCTSAPAHWRCASRCRSNAIYRRAETASGAVSSLARVRGDRALSPRGWITCGHQNQRPSSTAIDGMNNVRTTSVSISRPMQTVEPN
ncbi:hypothetical protein I552_9486 [Mycobacterium xenopi 3993]|nr:hypothetical protein I552_9486 [Mycobacterium xenopi 3993]